MFTTFNDNLFWLRHDTKFEWKINCFVYHVSALTKLLLHVNMYWLLLLEMIEVVTGTCYMY